MSAQTLTAPRSVAVIGASSSPAGHAGRSLSNLVRTGYPGRIYPVNPKYDELQGRRCYPDISALPEPPDVAYILLPSRRVVETVRECGVAGVSLAIICSSGFSEMGAEGAIDQNRIRSVAEQHGLRVMGPNCIGVVSPVGRYVGAPTFNLHYALKPGGVSILSHSGGMGVTVFNRAQAAGLGMHSLISLGNEADLDMTDALRVLLDDDDVHTFALVVEQLRRPDEFTTVASLAADRGKDVVAIKMGRSATGAVAVTGHTGALAGDHALYSAVLRECGVREATSIDQLVDTVHLLAATRPTRVGSRVGVVSPSGGESVYVADQAARHDIALPPLSPELITALKSKLPLGNPMNPLDMTGQVIGDPGLMRSLLAALGTQRDIDVLMVAVATWGEFDAEALLRGVVDAATSIETPVVFSAWDAGSMTDAVVSILSESGLAWFPSPDRALAALGLASAERPVVPRAEAQPGSRIARPSEDDVLAEFAALSLLRQAGLMVADEVIVRSVDQARDVAARMATGVVLKLNAVDVAHKTELGLVEAGLTTDASVRAAAERLLARSAQLGLSADGLLVARQEAGVEVLVGGVRDENLGPFVLVGVGGVLAEQMADTTLMRAPATHDSVRAGLRRLRGYPVLEGVRGHRNDVDALVDFVARFSQVFAGSPWMAEVDLNPVIVRPTSVGGAVAVDALVACRPRLK